MQEVAKNLYDVYFGENDIGTVLIQNRPGGVSFQCPLKNSKLTTEEIIKQVNERRREEQSDEANGSEVHPLDKANEEWASTPYSVLSLPQQAEDSSLSVGVMESIVEDEVVYRVEDEVVYKVEDENENENELRGERNESRVSSRVPIHPHAFSPQFELRERLRRRNASSPPFPFLVFSNKQASKQTNKQTSRDTRHEDSPLLLELV